MADKVGDVVKQHLKIQVQGAYDLQLLRMQMGLRLVGNFRAKLKKEGLDTPDPEDAIDPETGDISDEAKERLEKGELGEKAKKIIDLLKASYRTLTEGVAKHRALPDEEKFVGDPLISEFTELVLMHQYLEIEKQERRQFNQLTITLERIPIYRTYLADVIGIGPAMAGVLLTYFDIEKAEYASQFHSYAGLDVASDGRGRSRRKEHLMEREYIDKRGRKRTKRGLTYNGPLKSKLLGALATSFMRARNCPWRPTYDDYKHRLMTDPARTKCTSAHWKKVFDSHIDPETDDTSAAWAAVAHLYTPGRIHRMSLRYMTKMFLTEFHTRWRESEGLQVWPSYHEAKLGHVHKGKGRRPDEPEDDGIHPDSMPL